MAPGARTIYVRDSELWKQAETYAAANGLSVSQVVALALREYLARRDRERGATPIP
jgi:hypothetical protein